ncbi:MAG: Rieske 2Fe-2S domain-containing protein [Solirubrobacteraceae bacterium]
MRRSRSPLGELVVVGALLAASACAIAFVLLYVFDEFNTQLLGLALGLALGFLALAAIVAGKNVVDQRTGVEERPTLVEPEVEREVAERAVGARDGVSRRKLIVGAAGVAGVSVGAATIAPLASLGPNNVAEALKESPWRKGVPLVDDNDAPLSADQLEVGSWTTGFAQGANKRALGTAVVVVRILESEVLENPQWAPQGIMAYSKVCTHAGCAVSLFRYPTYEPTSQPPALVCPCHYSTFDVRRAAKVVFGPAGRPLPQLPLSIEAGGNLVAAGGYVGNIGPAWWGVRKGT